MRITQRVGAIDLIAARTDRGDLLRLLQCLARNLFGNAAYHLAGRISRRPALFGTRQVARGADQCSCRAGSSDHCAHACRLDSILNARNLARHESREPLQFALARWIVLEEFTGQAHGPERQAHGIPNLSLPRKRELAAAAAQFKQQNAMSTEPPRRDNAERNTTRLFKSGNDFDRPARRRAHPLQKAARIAVMAQGSGCHHLYTISAALARRTMEAPHDA